MSLVVVHYDEIALKGGRRRLFVRQLVRNIRRASPALSEPRVNVLHDRILLGPLSEDAVEAALRRLADLPGVSWYAPIRQLPWHVDSLKTVAESALGAEPPASFRVRARRSNKNFPLSSQEIEREVGRMIQERTGWPVDLEDAELTVHVNVVHDAILTYRDKIRGPGGLPVGSTGTLAALVSGGIDSPVAAYKMMCRGCRVVLVHFHNFSPDAVGVRRKLIELARDLARFQPVSRLYLVPFAKVQADLVAAVPPRMRMVAYRRAMLRLATPILEKERAQGFVVGDSIGQVASQTPENLRATYTAAPYPVFAPLIGENKQSIMKLARQIGTYDTSIQPYEDCCQLLLARSPNGVFLMRENGKFLLGRSPETRCTLQEITACEERLPIGRHYDDVRDETEVQEVVYE